jgi:hypothetical protein
MKYKGWFQNDFNAQGYASPEGESTSSRVWKL